MGYVGHGFGTAGDDARGIACDDGLGGEDDGFSPRSADFIDSGADGGITKAGVDGTLASWVLAQAGG